LTSCCGASACSVRKNGNADVLDLELGLRTVLARIAKHPINHIANLPLQGTWPPRAEKIGG
jgi:hypothetical protein